MGTLEGFFLVPTPKNTDTGLWFVFHHESEGVLAFDVTTPHPDMSARHFKTLVPRIEDKCGPVLLGGPEQSSSALLVLHTNPAAGEDAHVVNDDFTFHSFRFDLLPGQPPSLTRGADDRAADTLKLEASEPSVVILGFRLWEMDALETELRDWQWMLLPAAPDIVFDMPPQERLEKARRMIN